MFGLLLVFSSPAMGESRDYDGNKKECASKGQSFMNLICAKDKIDKCEEIVS